jgi:transcriptional regulator CtsR
MESVAAFGLACNIIQVVEFASKLVSRTHDCYNSIGGRIPQHAILNDAAVNLADLYSNLLIERETHTMKSTVADKQLINLQNKTEKAVKSLQQALENVRLKGDPTKWNSIYHALKSVLKDREISYLGSQLDTIRAEVDTVLLFSLRYEYQKCLYMNSAR